MASGGWEQHGGAAGAAGAGSCRGAKRRIWSRERSPGRAEEAAAVRVQGTLAAVASQQSKCLRRRLRSGGGGSRDRGNRGAAAAAAVETRPHPQVGISGAAAGLGPHPPNPFQPRAPDPTSRVVPPRAGRGREQRPGLGARSRTPTRGDPTSRIGEDLGHPFPIQSTRPDRGAGRGGCPGVPSLREGGPQRAGCTSARGLSEAALLWLLGATEPEGGPCRWESRSFFCLSAETGGRNCRQTPTSPSHLFLIPFLPGRNSPRQPFLRLQ